MNASVRAIRTCALALLSAACTLTAAQDFPTRTIRMVDTFAPGGTTDVIARSMIPELSNRLGQTLYVDNRPGGGGITGVLSVVQSPADGYSLLIGYDGTITVNPSLFSKLPYDPMRDLVPVIKIGEIPFVLVANPSFPPNNMRELVAYGKSNPDSPLFFGTAGAGSSPHLAGELLRQGSGLQLKHVPYKGGVLALQDVMAGQIPLSYTAITVAAPMIKAGKLKALGVASAKRSPSLPDVPTFSEGGISGLDAASWVGIFAPAKTPQPAIDRLRQAFADTLELPAIRKQLADLGVDVRPVAPAEFSAQIKGDLAKWAKVIREANIRVE